MAFLPWKEAIIKAKWADTERKVFFTDNKCGLEFNTSGRGTLLKTPSRPPATSTVDHNAAEDGQDTRLRFHLAPIPSQPAG